MDFTTLIQFKHTYFHNPDTGITTITFKDSGDNDLGFIKIESSKYRAFVESLGQLGKEQVDDWQANVFSYSTIFKKNQLEATTTFRL
jgi:hypothetical protein